MTRLPTLAVALSIAFGLLLILFATRGGERTGHACETPDQSGILCASISS